MGILPQLLPSAPTPRTFQCWAGEGDALGVVAPDRIGNGSRSFGSTISSPTARDIATDSDSAGSVSSGRKTSPPTGAGGSSSLPLISPENSAAPSRFLSSYFTRTTALIVKYWPWIVQFGPKRLFSSSCSRSDVRMKSDPSGGLPSCGLESSGSGARPASVNPLSNALLKVRPASRTQSGVLTSPSGAKIEPTW